MEGFFAQLATIINPNSLVALILGGAILVQQYRDGSKGLRKQITEDYKERNSQLEEKVEGLNKTLTSTNLTVARLEVSIAEKDKHIDSLTEILQGKNPEIIEILRDNKEINKKVVSLLEGLHKMSGAQGTVLDYQTSILEKGQKRSKKIDLASVKHKGSVMRVPKSVIKDKDLE